jgi:hypothetical protein
MACNHAQKTLTDHVGVSETSYANNGSRSELLDSWLSTSMLGEDHRTTHSLQHGRPEMVEDSDFILSDTCGIFKWNILCKGGPGK